MTRDLAIDIAANLTAAVVVALVARRLVRRQRDLELLLDGHLVAHDHPSRQTHWEEP